MLTSLARNSPLSPALWHHSSKDHFFPHHLPPYSFSPLYLQEASGSRAFSCKLLENSAQAWDSSHRCFESQFRETWSFLHVHHQRAEHHCERAKKQTAKACRGEEPSRKPGFSPLISFPWGLAQDFGDYFIIQTIWLLRPLSQLCSHRCSDISVPDIQMFLLPDEERVKEESVGRECTGTQLCY